MAEIARIAIVEDESIVAAHIEEALESFGYQVCSILDNGEEALERVPFEKPDLVLMDIKLRGKMDGIEAAAKMKQHLNAPVIYLTAHADDATLERAKVTEPYAYVLKPFKEMELRTAIEMSLHKYRSEQRKAGHAEPPDVEVDLESLSPERREIVRILSSVDPFHQVRPGTLARISANCRLADVKSGDFLAMEGDEEVSGFVVVKGRVAMLKTSSSGKELIVELLPPGDSFGLLASVERGAYSLTAKAQTDSRVLWVPRSAVLLILDDYPRISREFVDRLFARLRSAHDLSRMLAHELVEVRVASALLALVPRFCGADGEAASYNLEMTRQELANLTGTSPETVSRVLAPMERAGMVDLSKSGVVVLKDISRISQIAAPWQER